MNVDDFSYIRCVNCKKVIILPISCENNYTLLSNMCDKYNEMNECCKYSNFLFSSIEYGVEEDYLKMDDLPLKLRREFPPEVTHEFAYGKHLLFVNKHNGNNVIISVDSNNVMVTDDYATTIVYVMDD